MASLSRRFNKRLVVNYQAVGAAVAAPQAGGVIGTPRSPSFVAHFHPSVMVFPGVL